ncbi:mediator of RNA polymerase II transcription subunit 29 isoform X1 [Ahaetulla prasina]|uniref:mediator of RNA polymerase II transcription subunit 29 isoform X1 n=1 Tax=Ahaetulla prasina TaxID=499056 RepID=UPI0026486488|nr:mediator of RNA polymerase II transcription subunit 29 isoform X1 [Ahaetulla prasina]
MAAPPQPQVPPPQPQAPPQPPLMGQVGPSGAGGQQSAAGAPPLAAGPAPSGMQVTAQAQDFDPVQRFRLLLPQLKESLQNLMKVAAQNFVQNTSIDSGQKISEVPVQRVDKSLEEFYALCDQLELCLKGSSFDPPSWFVSKASLQASLFKVKSEAVLGDVGKTSQGFTFALKAPKEKTGRGDRRPAWVGGARRGQENTASPAHPFSSGRKRLRWSDILPVIGAHNGVYWCVCVCVKKREREADSTTYLRGVESYFLLL